MAGGVACVAVAIYHLMFWRILQWETTLASLSASNRNVMQIFNICLILVFIAFGYLAIFDVDELLATRLGSHLLVAIGLF
jgi:cytochrome bd-type quinol oxidase subunit 2